METLESSTSSLIFPVQPGPSIEGYSLFQSRRGHVVAIRLSHCSSVIIRRWALAAMPYAAGPVRNCPHPIRPKRKPPGRGMPADPAVLFSLGLRRLELVGVFRTRLDERGVLRRPPPQLRQGVARIGGVVEGGDSGVHLIDGAVADRVGLEGRGPGRGTIRGGDPLRPFMRLFDVLGILQQEEALVPGEGAFLRSDKAEAVRREVGAG